LRWRSLLIFLFKFLLLFLFSSDFLVVLREYIFFKDVTIGEMRHLIEELSLKAMLLMQGLEVIWE
jgi:hypothetical protein